MELPKTEINKKTLENVGKEEVKYQIEGEESEEPLFKKKGHNWMVKLLKLNPIDPLNKILLEFLEKLELTEKFYHFQWWLAYGIWCKTSLRAFWNFKAEGPLPPEYGPAIIVSNHESHLDPFFVGGVVHRPIRSRCDPQRLQKLHKRTFFGRHIPKGRPYGQLQLLLDIVHLLVPAEEFHRNI